MRASGHLGWRLRWVIGLLRLRAPVPRRLQGFGQVLAPCDARHLAPATATQLHTVPILLQHHHAR